MIFKERFKGKRLLFIPIYSMRDYQTGEYNLNNDGNFARILTALKTIDFQSADVLIPSKRLPINIEESNFRFIECNVYGENAKATRNATRFFEWLLDAVDLNDYDYIVVEPNVLAMQLAIVSTLDDKLIYWCVASTTSRGTPWFVEDYTESDKALASKVVTACANVAQVEYLGGKAYVEPTFYDASIFDYKTIFFPFRLTDENYHADTFVKAIKRLQQDDDVPPFKVLYTDPNGCGKFDNLEGFKKISSDHDVYLQVLKGRPIVPYLENDVVLEHISIHEFMYYHCELIMRIQWPTRDYDNIIYVDTDDELYNALKTLICK